MKVLIGALLLSASTLLHATKEVKAKIHYDVDNNRIMAIIIDTKNQEDRKKCEIFIRTEGAEIFKIISKNNNGRVLLWFICNLDITERR